MYTVNNYCRDLFGEKLYKISLNGGMTCPNRDGTCGTKGCIFCSAGGSGDFAAPADMDIDRQIENAKKRVADKYHGSRYIAYFQAYTNTYAPVKYLEELFAPVIKRDEIAVLSVATRPDCLGDDVLELLAGLNRFKPVWVELGLQTIHKRTSDHIRRGYELDVYDKAVHDLASAGIHVVTHVILGLPGESCEDMLETVKHIVCTCRNAAEDSPFDLSVIGGIKLQLLHVLKNTDLAAEYANGAFDILTLEEYTEIVCKCLNCIPDDMVIHRLTGDGPKKLLIAPLWSADKKRVLNKLNRTIAMNNSKNRKIHLFLTGKKQVGKSTLIKKLLEKDTRSRAGFITLRSYHPDDSLWYTHLLRPGESLSKDNILFCCSGDRNDSASRFDILGCRALEASGDLILMDELGPHEEKAVKFKEAVLDALDGDTPILGVLQKAESKFLSEIASHPKVRVVEVTEDNRNFLYTQLSDFIV